MTDKTFIKQLEEKEKTYLDEFSKNFPSLKEKEVTINGIGMVIPPHYKDFPVYLPEDIQQHCLDKQKVRDVFKRFLLDIPEVFGSLNRKMPGFLDEKIEAVITGIFGEIVSEYEKELGL